MTNSTQRGRKRSRSGIAAASAVSLALGAFSVVGPGPLASAEESLTGGIRGADGSRVINAGDQLQSDLGAGSCVVVSGSPNDSQAGFTWNTLEPSNNTTDKRTWGVSVAFDNSQDRTFAYWEWSSSSNNRAPVTFGSVPAAPAGESLGPNITASDQANEELEITNGPQITYGLKSDLSEAEVEKFAQAGAGSPVRYVWKTKYNQNNYSYSQLQATNQSSFIALVNPWPSENNECNPIEVTWEGIQQHVIVPGEDTKVGHIDVPALSDGSFDKASLSRMVVEVYDGNGKYIASSDTAASNGGKQLLRVDDNGDIYYTWPEYRGTDLAADKNVQFSVVARPRTTDQLEAANALVDFYGPDAQVFDSSNSLPRYSTANEIGRNTISLDDTEYHDPKYEKTEAAIISGVDSATGPLATEPQKVTFTQVPDKIAELVKTKGDGGFEAKVVLDERYVFEGWTAEMDDDYNVTVTAPENPKPGTFAQPRVTVTYSNGSTDELSLLVIVDPNNTQVTDLVRPDLSKGKVKEDITAQIALKPIMKGYQTVHPAKYEVDPATVPDGWTVTVDNTGKVTAKADESVAPGTVITPKITATYPDGTADVVEPQFQAIVDIKIPDYDTVTNKPNSDVTLTPAIPERGLSGNTTDEAPQRYTFEDGTTTLTQTDDSGTWTLKIDENTGVITTTIPKTAPEGYVLNVPVLAHYEKENPQKVQGTIVVIKGDLAPVYSVETTGPGKAVNHQIADAPAGSTFSFGKNPDGTLITTQTVDGWEYTIDPTTGVVTSTPPADAKPGDKNTTTVRVETEDGSVAQVPVTTVVKLTNSWEAEPSYPAETVYPGETAKSPIKVQAPEGVSVAKDTPFAINPEGLVPTGENNEHGNPTYKVVTANGEWVVGLDDKGNVISSAPDTAKPGDQIEVPVIVTYEDGSKDTVSATINVVDTPEREVPFKVVYKYDATVKQGTYQVETQGEAGVEKQKADGTWERTKEPVDEVVVIGTKPMSEKVEWKVPIPYSTIVRENPKLAPGETRVVQDGSNGEASYAAIFNGVNGESSVTETTARTEPKDRIVEYGPRLKDQDLVTETTRKIPFDTKVVFDDTLAAGKQVVDTQGVVGEEKVTSTQKLVDGKPSGAPVVTTETTTEKQDAVIRVGTMTEGQTTETVETTVPFGVKVEFDPNMPAGTSETVTEGKAGKKTITVTQKVTNSQPDGEATVDEKITEQPLDQVIKVGTKPSEASAQVKWTAPVPFEVETRPNPALKPGEIKVVQKGVPGEKTYTADFAAKGSDATVTPKEEQTKVPVKEIIEYGPRLDDQNLVTTVKKPVPFETEIVFDDTLASGAQEVKQYGRVGEDTVTSTQKLVDGQPSGDPVVETTRTEEPIKQIIRVGTKTTGTNTETITTEAPYKVVVKYDPNMPAGTSEVTTTGVPGEKTVTITRDITNSTSGNPTITEKITKQPVDEVITVGTKQATATDSVQWTEPIPFSTTLRPNPELKPGETRVVQEGKNGEASYVAVFTGTNGAATVKETKARTEPVERIVEYGPRAEDTSVVTKTEKPVPFETKIVFDDTLAAGEQVVDKQGELGTEVVTSTQGIVDGKPTGEPTVTTERTKEPVDAVVRVGTKTEGQTVNTYEAAIPFPVRVVYDPSLAPGESKVTQEGKPGTKKVTITQPVVNSAPNGEATMAEETVTEPTEQIVTVGTKPDEATNTATWTVDVPFKTVVRANPELKPGEVVTVQEGEYGEKKFTADFSSVGADSKVDTKEEQTKAPKDQIIEYGPTIDDQTLTSTTTNPVPFNTTFVADPNLPAGQQVVDKQGENGVDTITSTQEIKDGKPVGGPQITTERTKEPVDAVIRIGTKKPGTPDPVPEVSEVVDLPFTTRIVFDPTLEPGTEVEDVPGENGQVKVTVINGKPSVETVKEPVQRVVRVGSRPADGVEWTEEKAYEVKVVEAPTLEAGKYVVAQEGKPGRTVHNADGTETTTEPTDHIIKVGTKGVVPAPDNGKGSSDTAKRCVSNAFAANSPILWLLPVALLGAIGYGVNEAFGPQIQQASAQINEQIRRSMPDFGFGIEQPEWVRQINAQVDAINRQFAPLAKQLEPVGIVLGAIAAVSLTGVLIAQACSEDGFDNGLTALSSKK